MSKRTWVVVAVVALLAVTCAGALALYARGGGPVPDWLGFLSPSAQDPLAASGPAEIALRTLRLAGYEHAVVGDEAGAAVLRVQIPQIDTASDVDLAWQSGVTALATAYPEAGEYVVQVFEGSRGLVQVAWDGARARGAIDGDDADALLGDAELTFLTTEAAGE